MAPRIQLLVPFQPPAITHREIMAVQFVCERQADGSMKCTRADIGFQDYAGNAKHGPKKAASLYASASQFHLDFHADEPSALKLLAELPVLESEDSPKGA